MNAAPNAHDLHDDGVMEDLVEWVAVIAASVLGEAGFQPIIVDALAGEISGSFEDMLVNHYGED